MDSKRIEELRSILRKVTPGPWRAIEYIHYEYEVECGDHEDHETLCRYMEKYDAQFIAAARTALPELLDEVDKLKLDNERLQVIIDYGAKGGILLPVECQKANKIVDLKRELKQSREGEEILNHLWKEERHIKRQLAKERDEARATALRLMEECEKYKKIYVDSD